MEMELSHALKTGDFLCPFSGIKSWRMLVASSHFPALSLSLEALTPFSFNYFDTSVNAPVVVMCNLTSQPWFLSL